MNTIENQEKPDRDAKVVAMRLTGKTLSAIGEEHGITKERVRQICKRNGTLKPPKPIIMQKCEVCGVCYSMVGRRTCSSDCWKELLSRRKRDPDSKSSKYVMVHLTCDNPDCGIEFQRTKFQQYIHDKSKCKHNFCTRACYSVFCRKDKDGA